MAFKRCSALNLAQSFSSKKEPGLLSISQLETSQETSQEISQEISQETSQETSLGLAGVASK